MTKLRPLQGSVGLLLGGDVLQCELCHQAVEKVFVFIVSKPVQKRVRTLHADAVHVLEALAALDA